MGPILHRTGDGPRQNYTGAYLGPDRVNPGPNYARYLCFFQLWQEGVETWVFH